MNRKLAVAIAVVVVAGGGAAAYVALHPAPPLRPPAPPSPHASGMDHAMAAANALYDAPEGSSPCESAYLALKTSEDVAKAQNVKAVVLRLAPREDFLARCMALPAATQTCLVPKYLRAHRPECVPARPAPEVLKPMFELLQAAPASGNEGEPPALAVPPPRGAPAPR